MHLYYSLYNVLCIYLFVALARQTKALCTSFPEGVEYQPMYTCINFVDYMLCDAQFIIIIIILFSIVFPLNFL